MSTLYTPTNDTTNAARVSLLISGPCRQLFRDIFREEVSDKDFPDKLEDEEIKKILKYKSGLSKPQKIILYPKNGRFNASYDILDLSLLYSLIRNLSKHQPHKKGWGNIPDHSDRSVSANIDRIRYIRNTHCGHAVDFALSDTDFSQIWGELAVSINELEQIITGGCTTYTEAVKHLKTVDMDPKRSAEYLQKINKQQQTIEDLKDIDADVRDLIYQQKTMQLRIEREQFELKSKQTEHDRRIALLEIHTRPERENIKESTKAILKTHIESKVYFKTSSVKTTIAKLKEHGMVILSGKCGEGKSTTAYQVMHEISIENGSSRNPIIITEPEQWYKVINPQDYFVIYLEDIVGSTNIDGRTVEQWGKNLDTIYASIKNGKVLVIIGIRDSLLPEAKERFKHKLFQEAFEINLSSEEYSLTDNEKRKMIECFEKQMIVNQSSCKSHVQQVKENERCKLTDKEIAKIIKTDPFYGFPLTCWQFFSNTEFFRLGYEFFNHPDKNLLKSIEKKRKSKTFSEQLSYALLACVLVKGKLTPEKNEPDEILRRVCHELEIDIGKIKPLKIEDALEEIKELFLKQTSVEGEYIFSHEAVLEAVLVSFGKVAPDLVIGYCDMRKLRELVRTQGSNASEIVLKISKQNYIHLAKRLLRDNVVDRINCNTWDIAEDIIWHPATEDPEFVEALLSCTESAKRLEILPRLWYVIPGSFSSVMLDKLLELYGPHKIPAVKRDSRSRQFESNPFQITFPKLKTFLVQCVNNFAGKENTLCCVEYILKHGTLYPLVKDKFQYSPGDMTLLHCCILLGWEEVVDKILKIHQPTETENKWTCAHFASYIGNVLLLKKFVNLGVDVMARTEENYSVLQCAFIGMKYGSGETNWPLYSASEHVSFQMTLRFPNEAEYYELLQYLLECCPTLFEGNIGSIVDEFQNNILHYLIIQDYADILEFLCRNNTELAFHRNISGLPTAVHLAVYLGRAQILKAIWSDGVRPDQTDLSLQNTFDFGEKLQNKTLKFSRLYGNSKWCWNDRGNEICGVKMTILADVDVVFGTENHYDEVKVFLGSQHILKT